MGSPLPEAPVLRSAAEALDRAGVGGWLCDAEWQAIWVSAQTVALSGNRSPEELGVGRPILEAMTAPYWVDTLNQDDLLAALPALCAWIAGSGVEAVGSDIAGLYEAMTATPLTPDPGPVLTVSVRWRARAGLPAPARTLWFRLHDEPGAFAGTVTLAEADLPTELAFFLTRGDQAALQRMVRLVEPRRRAAAVLFVDLQGSGVLARRLTAPAYFEIVQRLTTAVDRAVVTGGGVVGKHAGDGVTAFFTAEELGSESGAARAAIEAARGVRAAVDGIDAPGGSALRINAGVHWSSGLYMGQLVTDGRLEVTALGDAVNECARLQESARDGEILASKVLLEQLTPRDAAAVGVDPDRVVFALLSERPDVPAKAVRDAGSIPVTALET